MGRGGKTDGVPSSARKARPIRDSERSDRRRLLPPGPAHREGFGEGWEDRRSPFIRTKKPVPKGTGSRCG